MEVRENSNYMYGVQDKQKHNQPINQNKTDMVFFYKMVHYFIHIYITESQDLNLS